MSIQEAFNKKKAFITFLTCGDPDFETTKELILMMQAEGVDLIELGIPFSDPMAEGPVISSANERALAKGASTKKVFQMVEALKGQVHVPLVFMTYANVLFSYGSEAFLKKCKEVNISGIIIPDIPYEEKEEFTGLCQEYGVAFVSFIAPTSKERIQMIAKETEGFLYCVSSLGVTGMRSEITADVAGMVSLAKEVTQTPVAVGFGISNAQQAKQMSESADGIIIGSAIVKLIGTYGKASIEPVRSFIKEIRAVL